MPHPHYAIDLQTAADLCRRHAAGETIAALAAEIGCSLRHIETIVSGEWAIRRMMSAAHGHATTDPLPIWKCQHCGGQVVGLECLLCEHRAGLAKRLKNRRRRIRRGHQRPARMFDQAHDSNLGLKLKPAERRLYLRLRQKREAAKRASR